MRCGILVAALWWAGLAGWSYGAGRAPRPPAPLVVEDRPWRTLEVRPFTNKTGREEWGYFSEALAGLLGSRLEELGWVSVRTQDLVRSAGRPVEIRPEGGRRRLVVLKESRSRDDRLRPDWVVRGSYQVVSGNRWAFRLTLDGADGEGHETEVEADQRFVLEDIHLLALPVWERLAVPPVRTVRIVSDPWPAEVRCDGEFVGHTPLTVLVDGRERLWEVSSDGRSLGSRVLTARTTTATAFFGRSEGGGGRRLRLGSVPEGAEVRVGTAVVGRTPLEGVEVGGGEIWVSMAKPGYREGRVRLRDGESEAVVRLRPERRVGWGAQVFWPALSAGVGLTAAALGCVYLADEYDATGLRRPFAAADLRRMAPWVQLAALPFFGLAVWARADREEAAEW